MSYSFVGPVVVKLLNIETNCLQATQTNQQSGSRQHVTFPALFTDRLLQSSHLSSCVVLSIFASPYSRASSGISGTLIPSPTMERKIRHTVNFSIWTDTYPKTSRDSPCLPIFKVNRRTRTLRLNFPLSIWNWRPLVAYSAGSRFYRQDTVCMNF